MRYPATLAQGRCRVRCEPRGQAGDHGTSFRLTGLPTSPAGTNPTRPAPTPNSGVPSLVARHPASLIPNGHCPYARRTGCGCFPMPTCNSGWPLTWLSQVTALGTVPATTYGPTLPRLRRPAKLRANRSADRAAPTELVRRPSHPPEDNQRNGSAEIVIWSSRNAYGPQKGIQTGVKLLFKVQVALCRPNSLWPGVIRFVQNPTLTRWPGIPGPPRRRLLRTGACSV